MNINTLNDEPLTSKTGKLAVALYPCSILGGENGQKGSYFARVINRSRLEQEDIADDIIANGSRLSKEEIVSVWKLINNAITCRLADGLSVNIGMGVLRPSISGVFDSANSEFNRKLHSIGVHYRPDRKLMERMSSLTPVIAQGNRIQPEITSVEDKSIASAMSNAGAEGAGEGSIIRSGGFFSIRGKNIMVLDKEGEDEQESTVGLYFDNLEDGRKSVRLAPSQIYHNSSSLLEGIVPKLEGGSYRIRVATRFGGGKEPRKAVLEHSFDKVFSVLL